MARGFVHNFIACPVFSIRYQKCPQNLRVTILQASPFLGALRRKNTVESLSPLFVAVRTITNASGLPSRLAPEPCLDVSDYMNILTVLTSCPYYRYRSLLNLSWRSLGQQLRAHVLFVSISRAFTTCLRCDVRTCTTLRSSSGDCRYRYSCVAACR